MKNGRLASVTRAGELIRLYKPTQGYLKYFLKGKMKPDDPRSWELRQIGTQSLGRRVWKPAIQPTWKSALQAWPFHFGDKLPLKSGAELAKMPVRLAAKGRETAEIIDS
jgi:hypothetical protein